MMKKIIKILEEMKKEINIINLLYLNLKKIRILKIYI